jgi:hypothetical protein
VGPVERWLPIPDHPGYEVSDQGRVRSYRDRQGHRQAEPRILAPLTVKGYQQIKLGRAHQMKVHVLVLMAFVGPRPRGMQACHRGDDPSNNALSNLRWATSRENWNDRRRNGRDHTSRRRVKLTADAVEAIRAGGGVLDLAKRYGVSEVTIYDVRSRRTWR